MRIAVTYENGQIFQHFGHTEQFKIYDVEDGKIVSAKVVDTNGSGHGALAGVLAGIGTDVLICGGIGGGAQMAYIRVYYQVVRLMYVAVVFQQKLVVIREKSGYQSIY